MSKLHLNDGGAVEVSMCKEAGAVLVIILPDASNGVAEVAEAFDDPETTGRMECDGAVYEGFTRLYGVNMTDPVKPEIMVTLLRG